MPILLVRLPVPNLWSHTHYLNAFSSSSGLSMANLHLFCTCSNKVLKLKQFFSLYDAFSAFLYTLINMKEISYPLSIFVSVSQMCHTFLSLIFPFPDHPHSSSSLLFQYEFFFPGKENSVRVNSLFFHPSSSIILMPCDQSYCSDFGSVNFTP